MIIVILKMVVRPEKKEDLIEIIRGILEPTRVEKGCLDYHLYQDFEDTNAFVVLEQWATQQDLERFVRSNNYRQLLAAMDLLAEPPEVKINAISYTAGLEAIQATREGSHNG